MKKYKHPPPMSDVCSSFLHLSRGSLGGMLKCKDEYMNSRTFATLETLALLPGGSCGGKASACLSGMRIACTVGQRQKTSPKKNL
jgi:hypothetical protein